MFLNNWLTPFVFSLHSPQIQLPQWDHIVAFHLTLATDLHLQALKISTCFSWASHINFNRKKKKSQKKPILNMFCISIWPVWRKKAKMASWRRAFYFLSLTTGDAIHKYIHIYKFLKKCKNFMNMNMKKVQIFHTTSRTGPVPTKKVAPKFSLLNVQPVKQGSLKSSIYCNFLEIFEDNRKNDRIAQRIAMYCEHTCLFQ